MVPKRVLGAKAANDGTEDSEEMFFSENRSW